MQRWIKKALTRRALASGPRGSAMLVEVEPSDKLVYGVTFAIISLASFTALQIAHLALLGRWNSEIFAAMTGLVGTILGVFFGKKG